MPKVIYSASKGLYQTSGSGVEIGDVSVVEASEDVTLAAHTAIAAYGNTVIDTTLGVMAGLTLAVNSNVGATKFVTMGTDGGDATVTLGVTGVRKGGTANLASLLFDDAGDYAQLISDGTKWICISATATEG